MRIIELILIALGLAMDAFAVSICIGLSKNYKSLYKIIRVGLYFGFFQGIMPVFGYYLGSSFSSLVESIDHWIAFFLLSFIGISMIKEAISDKEESFEKDDLKTMLLLAIATSIDAFVVGVTFAFINTNLLIATLLIGIITFILSIIGVRLGKKFGEKYSNKAEILGGIILILIGLKTLLEHLGIINI